MKCSVQGHARNTKGYGLGLCKVLSSIFLEAEEKTVAAHEEEYDNHDNEEKNFFLD